MLGRMLGLNLDGVVDKDFHLLQKHLARRKVLNDPPF
jgi:hypothetical protein